MSGKRSRRGSGNQSRLATSTEAELIERYFTRTGRAGRYVSLGVGDDAAVTRLPAGSELVAATDTIAEGVHFPRGTPAHALGHRCLAVNLSDMAAMGAEPLWATLALSMPKAAAPWLRQFSRGLFSLADRHGVTLIGGDTIRGPLVISVTILGRVKRGVFVRRAGARPGDGLYVTGSPGDAVAGRMAATGDLKGPGTAYLRRRFLYPEPRVQEGRCLATVASAMIDVSDGLHDDAGKLLRASGCGALLDARQVPLSGQLVRIAGARAALELALTGGDDYELLFAVPPQRERRLRRLAGSFGCIVTRFGTVTADRRLRWQLDGKPLRFRDRTFRHFD